MGGTYRKGKTYEEIYGKKKSEEIKLKKGKGKTYKEMYGDEKAEEIKEKLSRNSKGKNSGSYEKRYGKEKADKIKEKMKLSMLGKNKNKKGMKLEEIRGKKKAQKLKLYLSKLYTGVSYEKKYGKEKANKIKEKISKKRIGRKYEEMYGKDGAKKVKEKIKKYKKGKTYEEMYGKEKAKKIKLKQKRNRKSSLVWTKNKIIKNLTNIINKVGPIKRSDVHNLSFYYDICGVQTIRQRFGSLDNLTIESNIEFKLPSNRGKLGENEKQILDNIEKENNITLLRQFSVAGKYIDGYDRENNIAYEVDEWKHKYIQIEDRIRENQIKEVLGCEFVRINDD